MPLVWVMPDESVRITRIVPAVLERERRTGESTSDVVLRLAPKIQAKIPELVGRIPVLVTEAGLPSSRALRYKWRYNGAQVIEDPTVPTQVKPKTIEERLTALEAKVP